MDLNLIEQDKTEGKKTYKQAATGASCNKGLAEHLKGGNSTFGDVHEHSLTAKDLHPSIKNKPCNC